MSWTFMEWRQQLLGPCQPVPPGGATQIKYPHRLRSGHTETPVCIPTPPLSFFSFFFFSLKLPLKTSPSHNHSLSPRPKRSLEGRTVPWHSRQTLGQIRAASGAGAEPEWPAVSCESAGGCCAEGDSRCRWCPCFTRAQFPLQPQPTHKK